MLKIKQFNNELDENEDIIDGILKNHGIKDVEKFKNILDYQNDCPHTTSKDYKNMDYIAMKIGKWIKNNDNIGIVIDDDADGYTSSAMLFQYLNEKILAEKSKSKITPVISEQKEHGFCKVFEYEKAGNKIPEKLIVPDAGSNDVNFMKKLISKNIDFAIIDHHDVEKEAQKFFEHHKNLTNCMFKSPNANKNLTGVGMVYKLLQTMNNIYRTQYKISNSLFAIGEIGDSADVSDLEIRKIMVNGLTFIDNKFLNIYFPAKDDTETLSPNSLSFSIIPRINSVARIGNIEQRKILLYALSEFKDDLTFDVEKRRKSKITHKFKKIMVHQDYYEHAKDCFDKLKGKQDKFVKNEIKNIKYLSDKNFILGYVQSDDDKLGSVIGLIANKIMSKTQKPVILVHNFRKGIFNGSLRAPGTLPFKSILQKSKLFNFVSGHEQAAGVEFVKENLIDIIKYYENYDFGIDSQEIVVDNIFTNNNKNTKDEINEINKNEFCFGGKIPNPVLGFKNITVYKKAIFSRGKTASFLWHNVKFIMFNGQKLKDVTIKGFINKYQFDVVGQIMKDWNGNPQIAIDFFDTNKTKQPQKEQEFFDTDINSASNRIVNSKGKFIF